MGLSLVLLLSSQLQTSLVHLYFISNPALKISFCMFLICCTSICKGRKRELIIAAVLYFFGAVVTSYAPGLGVLLVGRLLYGLGIGLVSFWRLILRLGRCNFCSVEFYHYWNIFLKSCHLTGNAWCSSLYCRNLSISDSWNFNISKRVIYSSRNFGKIQVIYALMLSPLFKKWVESWNMLFRSWAILSEAFRLMQLEDGVTCMGLVLHLHYSWG